MDSLVIALKSPSKGDSCSWIVIPEEGEPIQGEDTLETLSARLDELDFFGQPNTQTIALIPDHDVLFSKVEVPARTSARVKQALPYALEPKIAEDIEQMHVAMGEFEKGKPVECATISNERLEEYVSVLDQTGLEPNVMSTLGLVSNSTERLNVINLGSEILLTMGDSVVTISRSMVNEILQQVEYGDHAGQEVVFYGFELENEIQELLETKLSESGSHTSLGFEAAMALAATQTGYINLRQGSFRLIDKSTEVLKSARRILLTAASVLLVVSVLFLVEGTWAKLQETQLLDEASAIYKDVYAVDQVVGNPIFRMQERMAESEQHSSWLTLLNGLYTAHNASAVNILSIDYQDGPSEMSITCTSDSFQDFEEFKKNLESRPLQVEVNSAEQQGSEVLARVAIAPL